MKNILFFLLFLTPCTGIAQGTDSVFIRDESDGRWMARYRVQNERNVFEVAKKFSVPAAMLADANRLSYTDPLAPATLVKIPLTVANWYNYTPPASSAVAPLYYRTTEEWDRKDLARLLGISARQLEEWNNEVANDIEAGQVVAVGWISVSGVGPSGSSQGGVVATSPISAPPVQWPDTVVMVDTAKPIPVISPMEQAFLDQTSGGAMLTTEKGPAAFFPAGGGTVKGVHYAFHNSAARGSVMRVHNPGTGKTVYVKVLGPLPRTKQYAGAIIGIAAAAKAQLGVRGDARAWCEVSYAGY